MALSPDVVQVVAHVTFASDTEAVLSSTNPVPLANQPVIATDTGIIKIGDGTTPWNLLPVRIDAVLTQAEKTMLVNKNAANGVAVIGEDGRLSMDLMPTAIAAGSVKFVADIAARDALVGDAKNGLIYVIDASADTDVTLGSAFYVWHEDTTAWEMIGEQESMNIDLTPYFNHETENISIIADGDGFVKMTEAERATLADLDANALRKDQVIAFVGVNAAAIAAANPA